MTYTIIIDCRYEKPNDAINAYTALAQVTDLTKINRRGDSVQGWTGGEKRNLRDDLIKIKDALSVNCVEGYLDIYLHHESICIGEEFEDEEGD